MLCILARMIPSSNGSSWHLFPLRKKLGILSTITMANSFVSLLKTIIESCHSWSFMMFEKSSLSLISTICINRTFQTTCNKLTVATLKVLRNRKSKKLPLINELYLKRCKQLLIIKNNEIN